MSKIYLDTNIFIYAYVNQGDQIQKESAEIIRMAIEKDQLIISTLLVQELIFGLAKLKSPKRDIESIYKVCSNLSKSHITFTMVKSAYRIARKRNMYRDINDIVHLKFAEKHCSKLITANYKDFKKLRNDTHIDIEFIDVSE